MYKKETSFKDRDYKNNCLIKALRNIEINDIVLQDIMLKCKNRCIPMYVLKEICIKHKFTINLKIFYEKRNTRKMKYGTEGQVIELCLYDDHFFLNEKVDITYYALTHYEELKDKENWNMYFTENRIYNTDDNKDRSTDSFEIVKYLIDNKDKFLERIPISNEMFETFYHNKFNDDDFITLDYDDEVNVDIYDYKKEQQEKREKEEKREEKRQLFLEVGNKLKGKKLKEWKIQKEKCFLILNPVL